MQQTNIIDIYNFLLDTLGFSSKGTHESSISKPLSGEGLGFPMEKALDACHQVSILLFTQPRDLAVAYSKAFSLSQFKHPPEKVNRFLG